MYTDYRKYKKNGFRNNQKMTKMCFLRGTVPPFVVTWKSEKNLVEIFVVVDARGLETGFTLGTNRKREKEKLLKRT